MRLTNEHLRFWQARKATPKWAVEHGVVGEPPLGATRVPERPPSVHALIAGHAGDRSIYGWVPASNTLGVLKMARRRGELVVRLKAMALNPGKLVGPQRRAAFCRRWYERITGEKLGRQIDNEAIRKAVLWHDAGEPTREGYRVAWRALRAIGDISHAAREVVRLGLTSGRDVEAERGINSGIEDDDDLDLSVGIER